MTFMVTELPKQCCQFTSLSSRSVSIYLQCHVASVFFIINIFLFNSNTCIFVIHSVDIYVQSFLISFSHFISVDILFFHIFFGDSLSLHGSVFLDGCFVSKDSSFFYVPLPYWVRCLLSKDSVCVVSF